MKPNFRELSVMTCIGLIFSSISFAQTENTPINMGSVINTAARDAEPTFMPDGQTMYFNCFDRQGKVGGDICMTERNGDGWTEPEIVEAVSTDEYLEVEPLLSPDGSQLYIMSNRPGVRGSAS